MVIAFLIQSIPVYPVCSFQHQIRRVKWRTILCILSNNPPKGISWQYCSIYQPSIPRLFLIRYGGLSNCSSPSQFLNHSALNVSPSRAFMKDKEDLQNIFLNAPSGSLSSFGLKCLPIAVNWLMAGNVDYIGWYPWAHHCIDSKWVGGLQLLSIDI